MVIIPIYSGELGLDVNVRRGYTDVKKVSTHSICEDFAAVQKMGF